MDSSLNQHPLPPSWPQVVPGTLVILLGAAQHMSLKLDLESHYDLCIHLDEDPSRSCEVHFIGVDIEVDYVDQIDK